MTGNPVTCVVHCQKPFLNPFHDEETCLFVSMIHGTIQVTGDDNVHTVRVYIGRPLDTMLTIYSLNRTIVTNRFKILAHKQVRVYE